MNKLGFYEFLVRNKGLSHKTAYLYANRMSLFYRNFGPIEDKTPEEVLGIVLHNSNSASSHNSWVSAIKRYEEYLAVSGQLFEWGELLHNKPNNKRLPKPFTEKEIDAICQQVPLSSLLGKRDRAIIELLYCGLRNNEVCETTIASLADQTVLVFGKGAKERYVPINDVAWYHILDYILLQHGTIEHLELAGQYGLDFAFVRLKETVAGEDRVFLTVSTQNIYPRAVRNVVYRYAKRAGVENAHPHRFRHSFATHTLDAGLGNLTALKDVLGHSKFDMVQKYVLTTKTGREKVKSFHPRQRREMAEPDV